MDSTFARNIMKYIFTIIATIVCLQSCAPTLPGPTKTKHITTESAGFMLEGSPRRAQYSVSYTFRDLMPGEYTAVVLFDNPAAPSSPIQVSETFRYPVQRILVESPFLKRIKFNGNYTVGMELHQGRSSGPLIDSHSQSVNFGISGEMGRKLGVATQID